MVLTSQYFTENLPSLVQKGQIKVGHHTYGVPKIRGKFGLNDSISIGKFCSIATGVKLFIDNGNHLTTNISAYPFFDAEAGFVLDTIPLKETPSRIEIGNDVWICEDVSIFAGVTIGNGAIIGAGSVIRRSIPDYAIVIGNPEQIVKYRFSSDKIEKLLQLKWWDKLDNNIPDNVLEALMNSDVDTLITLLNG